MKKRRNLNEIDYVQRLNPVAKHAHRFNKAKVFDDKSQYRRKAKHSKQEAFPRILDRILRKASCISFSNAVRKLSVAHRLSDGSIIPEPHLAHR
ncbi:hypothetical protein [Methylomicrobium sp. Wu6]|uniref:DUF7230 family protein n=1 Tax=Methylomicrobium sp. Wu6 TaxID=3107928 RepID=UPI002DD68FF9|nr:hypothetical protein [Methylomicrobium sp. Wu6]MEC4748803.1 hypothetical protein [Methylomicrobium sp. Wu6]